MDLKNVQKQGRGFKKQEDYPTSSKYTADVGWSLRCFLTFFRSIPTWNEIQPKLFPSVLSFWVVSNPNFKLNSFWDSLCYSPPNMISHCRQTRLSLETRLRTNFSHAHTYSASYQRLPNWSYVEMSATYRYSPLSTGGITISYQISYSKVRSCSVDQNLILNSLQCSLCTNYWKVGSQYTITLVNLIK